MKDVAEKLGKGDLGARADTGSGDEIDRLATSFNRMAEALQQAEDQRSVLISELEDKNAELEQFTALRDLSLLGANITARGLRHLQNLQTLEHLNLDYVQIGDEAVPVLRQMTNLKRLLRT